MEADRPAREILRLHRAIITATFRWRKAPYNCVVPDMSLSRPQFSWHDWNQWHLGVLPLLMMFAALMLYMIGTQRVGFWSAKRTVSFLAGLIVTFIATQSVIGVFDMEYFSDHMIQHLLLIMVAAPLFALSAPLDLAYDAGSERLRHFLDGRFMTLVTQPLFGFAAYFVFIPITHLTGLFNLMMEHEWVHHLEQIGFLVVGYLFFRVAFGLERRHHDPPRTATRLRHGGRARRHLHRTGARDVLAHALPGYKAMAPRGSTTQGILANIHLAARSCGSAATR